MCIIHLYIHQWYVCLSSICKFITHMYVYLQSIFVTAYYSLIVCLSLIWMFIIHLYVYQWYVCLSPICMFITHMYVYHLYVSVSTIHICNCTLLIHVYVYYKYVCLSSIYLFYSTVCLSSIYLFITIWILQIISYYTGFFYTICLLKIFISGHSLFK